MSILMTGGNGLIGVSLAQMTLAAGERPVLFDIAPIHPILRKIDSKFNVLFICKFIDYGGKTLWQR
jgi:nucleoside-diphosphate-sugar epimerase